MVSSKSNTTGKITDSSQFLGKPCKARVLIIYNHWGSRLKTLIFCILNRCEDGNTIDKSETLLRLPSNDYISLMVCKRLKIKDLYSRNPVMFS